MAVQMLCDQLDGLAGADQQRAVALESGENLACQAYCRIGDGYRAGADVGVRPNMLRYRKCMLKLPAQSLLIHVLKSTIQ